MDAGRQQTSQARPVERTSVGSGDPREARTEAIYQQIYGAIVDHRLPPGTRLREEALCEAFNVSRTRIRKVLQRLGHEQIVELHPNRGACVAQPSVKEARDIFLARRVVESELVAMVARSADKATLTRLRGFVRQEKAARKAGDIKAMIRLSGDFHLMLAEIADNGPLLDFLRELVSRTSLIIALYEAPDGPTCNCNDHEALVKLIAAGDAASAIARMTEHLRAIEENLRLEMPARPAVDFKDLFQPLGKS